MKAKPGLYAGYNIRQKQRGSARYWLDPTPELWHRNMAKAEKALAEPYRGITTDGHVLPGLYPLMSTGIPTRRVMESAGDFLSMLDERQRGLALHPVDSEEWRRWCNWEQYTFRHGLSFEEMTPPQKEAALTMLRESLGVRGFEAARNVMKLNHTLAEITGNWEWLGEWIYFISIFGEPHATEPWGWQLDGHHLNISYFVLGDQVVLSPGFWGAEPTHADRGVHQGLRMFEEEERSGLELINALDPGQRSKAVLFESMVSTDHPPGRYDANNGRQQSVAFQDNVVIPYEGIRADALSRGQRSLLTDLIGHYTNHLRPGHAEAWMRQVISHLDDTHFAWIGRHGEHDPFYYKIHSPVLLVEFDMHKGVFIANDEPEKFHVHVTLRSPNGNDYGRDLLRQHLERDHHLGRPHSHP